MIKRIALVVIPLGLVALVVFLTTFNSSADKEDILQTIAVERGSITDKAVAVGQIEPRRETPVKAKIPGIVRTVYVEVGDHVNVGEPLFDIKPDPTPVEFANAKREVELHQVTYDQARREFNRSQQLRDKQLISHQDHEQAQAVLEEADLRLKLAREKLALIESGRTEVADRTVDNIIKSPISGTVLSLLVEEGDPVVPLTAYQAGTELMTMAQMDNLIFKGTVDEIDVGRLEEQMTAEIEIGALPENSITGTVGRISPKARRQEGATVFDVEIEIDDIGQTLLRAGYSANASVIISSKYDILVIPERLVTMTDSLTTVEISDTAGNITTREVVTGLSDGIHIEIAQGLSEGDLVVERPPREINPWD
jgi:HlyD family secretion protein